jgi:hypothetical protein
MRSFLEDPNMIKQIYFYLTALILLGCSMRETNKPNQSIFLFKDKDGLYQYDPATDKEKNIFKASDKQIFIDEPCQLSNGTLTFGLKGELTFIDSGNHSQGETYFKDYISVVLKSGRNWVSKKIIYKVIEYDTLKIKTQFLDTTGKVLSYIDTSASYTGSLSTYKGITYNDFKPRFFSKATFGDESVYSLQGSIYFVDKSDTTLLVKYKGRFDPKFGSGYFQPQIDPTRRFVIFNYLPGFINFKEETSLQKIDLKTKVITKIKTGDFNEPTFSKDGKFILFKRNQRQGKNKTWISDIYLLDLKTLKEWKISEADAASWAK